MVVGDIQLTNSCNRLRNGHESILENYNTLLSLLKWFHIKLQLHYLRGGWSGVGVGEAGLNRIVKTALSQRG